MKISSFKFKNFEILLINEKRSSTMVSQSSQLLVQIIPLLSGCKVLDLGCGIGYFTVGALYLGAREVVAVDIEDVKEILKKNVKINQFDSRKVIFIKSDLFSKLPKNVKFDVIIANLPQHALPATPSAQKLKGKYGGYDGTDLVCRALTEGAYYLQPNGKYFGAISELTNFKRTLSIARLLYNVKIRSHIVKTLRSKEMLPHVKDEELFDHLNKLKQKTLINYTGNGIKKPIQYIVHLCEFILKKGFNRY